MPENTLSTTHTAVEFQAWDVRKYVKEIVNVSTLTTSRFGFQKLKRNKAILHTDTQITEKNVELLQ